MSNIRSIEIEKIKFTVEQSTSLREVLIKLELDLSGNNYVLLKQIIINNSISTDHLLGKSHKKSVHLLWSGYNKIPIESILISNSTYQTSKLSKRLQKEKIIPYQCKHCGLSGDWNGQPLTLHLDHINGINNDHRIENLRFLCPNCHSQTPTYCGRNSTGKRKPNKIKYLCPECQGPLRDNRASKCRKCYLSNRCSEGESNPHAQRAVDFKSTSYTSSDI